MNHEKKMVSKLIAGRHGSSLSIRRGETIGLVSGIPLPNCNWTAEAEDKLYTGELMDCN